MPQCAVSVIIPLYNAEKYINQCLRSILAQKFTDFEVIIVDDCSTDKSLAEVGKFLPYFGGRLKILSTGRNSGGAGVPRNVGIKNASGKYVTFVDNDDLIMPNTLSDFFAAAEEFQADVVHTEKYIVFADNDLNSAQPKIQSDEPKGEFVDKPTLEPKNLQERLNRYLRGKFFWLPWGKFYRRDFLLANKIEFPQVRFSEDMVFCFECMCLAEKYLRVPHVNNIHRIREDSTARNYNLQTWLVVVTKIAATVDNFMSEQEFFRSNSAFRYAVLKFIADKSFGWIKAFQEDVSHEVYELFFDELQSPALDQKGKNIIAAYLYTERAMSQKR